MSAGIMPSTGPQVALRLILTESLQLKMKPVSADLSVLLPQCELAAMEGMTACMTYYPRACGSLKVRVRRLLKTPAV